VAKTEKIYKEGDEEEEHVTQPEASLATSTGFGRRRKSINKHIADRQVKKPKTKSSFAV
jgi:hypothetical protein